MSIPLIPGPSVVPIRNRSAFSKEYGSSDLEQSFFDLYGVVEKQIQTLFHTKNQVVIMSGEAMVVLWGGVKSILKPGDTLLAISSGLFGNGFAGMAKAIGGNAILVEGKNGNIPDINQIEQAISQHKPKLITAVHCETPSGMINPINEYGALAHKYNTLFLVDFVSSGAGTDIDVDSWHIDIGLLGSQKALSLIPDLGIALVSEKAWKTILEVNYSGYDAFSPFKTALADKYFPYTMNWQSIQALHDELNSIFEEGPENVYKRHLDSASVCRSGLIKLGLKLYPVEEKLNSPTCTCAYLPQGWTWEEFDSALRAKGVQIGGSYGDLQGKVFRVGHMGSQASVELIEQFLQVLEEILKSK